MGTSTRKAGAGKRPSGNTRAKASGDDGQRKNLPRLRKSGGPLDWPAESTFTTGPDPVNGGRHVSHADGPVRGPGPDHHLVFARSAEEARKVAGEKGLKPECWRYVRTEDDLHWRHPTRLHAHIAQYALHDPEVKKLHDAWCLRLIQYSVG